MGGFCWQRIKDSNPDKQIQNLSCYLYTNPLYALFLKAHKLLYPIISRCQEFFNKNSKIKGKLLHIKRINALSLREPAFCRTKGLKKFNPL